MKTYSRKNSSYLKKAFIASNFNEMCRLCLSELDLGLTPIFQEFSKISYQEWIQYSVDVLIEEGDGLPPNICEECLALVEQTYLFKKKCKASDSKLREHLELMESTKEEKLNDTGLIDLSDNKRNTFQVDEQMEKKCDESNAVDSGGTDNEPSERTQEQITQHPPTEVSAERQPQKMSGEETIEKTPEEKVEASAENEKPMLYSVIEFEDAEPQEKVIRRYILKGEKKADDQEEDLTVCEVVPLDVKNEDSTSSDMEETLTYTRHEGPSQNGSETEVEKTQDAKVQELYELWDNEEYVEEGQEEEEEEEYQYHYQYQEQEQEEGENEGQGIMILDVSWGDNTDKNQKKQNTGILEVDVEQNGVVKLHKIISNNSKLEGINTIKTAKILTKMEGVTFKCFVCGKDFSTGVELKLHLTKFHHDASDAAFCEVCGKSFVCMNNLKRHMSIHTGYKPHKCKICGRTFSQGSILKRHIFTHETLKPFNCQICGKGYTQKMNLLSHFRNHGFRTEGEIFSCQFCNKTFQHQSGLSRHINLHKGVKFSCDHCDKMFGDSSALTRHMKTIHPNK